jgi:hypothetical protein
MSIPFFKNFSERIEILMNEPFMLLPVTSQNKQTVIAIRGCNEFTARYGLQLSEPEIQLLTENRREALERSGRIEFGGGVIQKLIMEFFDSPFLRQENYVESLMELQECFYYFKNESLEELSDDELIKLMKKYFDDVCQGSVEYLQTTMLENYCRDVRYGKTEYRDMDGYEDDYTEFLDWDERE